MKFTEKSCVRSATVIMTASKTWTRTTRATTRQGVSCGKRASSRTQRGGIRAKSATKHWAKLGMCMLTWGLCMAANRRWCEGASRANIHAESARRICHRHLNLNTTWKMYTNVKELTVTPCTCTCTCSYEIESKLQYTNICAVFFILDSFYITMCSGCGLIEWGMRAIQCLAYFVGKMPTADRKTRYNRIISFSE